MTATHSDPVLDAETGTSATPSLRNRLIRIGLALVVVLGSAYLVWRRRADLATAVEELSMGRFLLSGVFAVLGTVLTGQIWVALLHGMGLRPGPRDSHSVFYVSQLGKYLPGSVWPVLAQMQFGLRWGAARRTMLGANIIFMGVVVASGIGVGAILLPWSSPDGLTRYWWLLLCLVPLAVGLHPRVVPGALDWILTRTGRPPLGVRVSGRGLAVAIGWAVAAWVALGVHLTILLQAYDGVSVLTVAAATGGMALAWAAGIVFIPAPAGAGIRETLLVITLGPLVGTAAALTVALASRVLLLIADVLLAGLGALVGRRTP